LTPAQKAAFVAESQQRAPDALTLAIGDGANDEQMIRQADVGVGLSGLEGSAAARASDFSVSHFRSLHTLLLVHGVWNYRRMALVVQYVFYKSTLQAAVAFLFGFVSAFSGQQFVNDIHVQLYGVLFTALPTVVVGILDQALPRHVVENSPHVYRSVRRGALFNLGTFSGWMVRAFLHAVITFFITRAAVGDAPDVLQWSNVQFSAQVFVVNIEILLHAHSVTFVTVASVVFANFSLMVVSFITSYGKFALGFSPNFLGVFRMTAMPSAVLACALSIVCAHAVSFVWQYVNVTWFPSFIDTLRDRHAHDEAED
jgi:magnesium-transporting ATPase (P-type)